MANVAYIVNMVSEVIMAVEENMGSNGSECTQGETRRLFVHAEGCFMEREANLAAESTGISIAEQDQRDIQDLYSKLRAVEAKLVGPDGKTQVLPGSLYSFLCLLLADLKDGKSVTILQSEATLTTMEAAKILGVSRQFLIQEIEKGRIPYHMVGTHRRLYARDVLAFKSHRDASRRKQLDDLALAEYEDGLYARGLDDPHSRQ